MNSIIRKLGIQSYCFRGFSGPAEVIENLQAAGVTTVELWRKHAFDFNLNQVDEIVEQFNAADISIVSIGVELLTGDEAHDRPLFEFCRRAKVPFMSVNFQPSVDLTAFHLAQDLAEEYNMKLGIHNHGGKHWLGNMQMLDHVFANTGDRIGLCLDTAWAIDAGHDPVAMADHYGDRLQGIHIKDFVYDRHRKFEDVIVGSGNLDLPALAATLVRINFQGYTILEYEGDFNNPLPALKECVKVLNEVFA